VAGHEKIRSEWIASGIRTQEGGGLNAKINLETTVTDYFTIGIGR
jgi:hypothetical protein